MNFSVALATRNGERFLAEQLHSISRQSCRPVEIIISDDGSTDKTVSILRDFQERSHIPTTILPTTSPKGINENFARAFMACRGDYIAVSDQDDIWPPDKLEAFAKQIDKQTLIAYGPSEIIDDTGAAFGKTTREYIGFSGYRHGHLPLYFLHCNCVSGHAMIFSRRLLVQAMPFPKNCLYDHWLSLCGAVQSDIVFVENGRTLHRIHQANSINQLDLKKQAKKTGPKKSKSARYLSGRAEILKRIQKAKELGTTLSVGERETLNAFEHCLQRGETQLFDMRLFLLLYRHSREMFGSQKPRECYKRAFGNRWHALLDTMLGRQAK